MLPMITFALVFAAASTQPAMSDLELEGRVKQRRTGVAGRSKAVLVTQDKAEYTLYGQNVEHEKELLRLTSLGVKVKGRPIDSKRSHHIRIGSYQIVDVGGGEAPMIGQLASLMLESEKRLVFVSQQGQAHMLPRSWMKKMKKHIGATLWMIGNQNEEGVFRPRRFSILRQSQNIPTQKRTNP